MKVFYFSELAPCSFDIVKAQAERKLDPKSLNSGILLADLTYAVTYGLKSLLTTRFRDAERITLQPAIVSSDFQSVFTFQSLQSVVVNGVVTATHSSYFFCYAGFVSLTASEHSRNFDSSFAISCLPGFCDSDYFFTQFKEDLLSHIGSSSPPISLGTIYSEFGGCTSMSAVIQLSSELAPFSFDIVKDQAAHKLDPKSLKIAGGVNLCSDLWI
jgi:hypothetical protein